MLTCDHGGIGHTIPQRKPTGNGTGTTEAATAAGHPLDREVQGLSGGSW